MAQLYFYYAAMNAGKSTSMLQSAYNYREQGMHVLVLTAAIDNRYGVGKVTSRIGLQSEALLFKPDTDLCCLFQQATRDVHVHCILVDEAQFLNEQQVRQLTKIVDKFDTPVLCYGLRTDFKGDLFPGSQCLLAWADKLIELKTVCFCGRKATMVVRLDADGQPLQAGDQVAIGGNDIYQSMCRAHFAEKIGW